jgi:Na+:H+ antiporter, NhaA family
VLSAGPGRPLTRFLRVEASASAVLLAATAVALVWANSPWSEAYAALWNTPLVWREPARYWVNDGLMTVFFLVVGLEIRREFRAGALASRQTAILPAVAAVGGMVAPALIYLALNQDPALRRGWAIPTATDIAFAVGVLALLGKRVPPPLRALLLAIAIVDDLGAVLIIAFVYARGIVASGLVAAALTVVAVLVLDRVGIRLFLVHVLAVIAMWTGLRHAGIHPTVSGVILAFLIPAGGTPERLSTAARVENALHPWVAYGVMPLFALANAGVALRAGGPAPPYAIALTATLACALVLGKPLGIVLTTLACVKLRLCSLPREVSLAGLLVAGCLGGIGFTMSIFIAALAFTDTAHLTAAKWGILIGSACAAVLGLALGVLATRKAGRGADDAA